MPRRPSFHVASLLFSCAALAGVHAAELGDAKVNSYVGQQLSADIELTSIDDPAGLVQVRLASLDVYRGAGLEMPAVLASVNLNVVRRDGKQFLHVTSIRPIEADHLHLYLELTDGTRRGVRLATLWFAPDPAPPRIVPLPTPAPAPAPAREAAPARTARAVPASQHKLVRPTRESARIAATDEPKPVRPLPAPAGGDEATPTRPVAEPAVAKPPVEAKPAPPVREPVRAVASAEAKPARTAAVGEPKTSQPERSSAAIEPKATPEQQPAQPAHATVREKPAQPPRAATPDEPKPLPLAGAVAKTKPPIPVAAALPRVAAACSKQPSQTEGACTALDSKNAELRAELVKLEARVKSLQEQELARAAASAKAEPPKAAAPVEPPKPAALVKPAVQPNPSKPAQHPKEIPAADEKFGQVMDERPAPIPAFKPVKLKPVVPARAPLPPKPEEKPAGMPWGWLAAAGGGVFALIGALQFWRHRRKQAKGATVHAPLPDDEDVQVEPTLV